MVSMPTSSASPPSPQPRQPRTRLRTNAAGRAYRSSWAVRKSTADIQNAVTQLTSDKSVISTLSAPATAQSLEDTVKNLQEISRSLVTVTHDAQKVVTGISTIFEQ